MDQYLHRIWQGSAICFFVDGYVRLQPDALEKLASGVLGSRTALGGTGAPSTGRSKSLIRRELAAEGGMHGNCCCITRAALLELRERGFHFPLGLYRVDGLLGAVLAFRMDPAQHGWDPKRAIHVELQATWATDPKRWWRLSDLRATLKRRRRQAQGQLENLAVRDHLALRRQQPEQLPATAAQLVLDWAARSPDAAHQVCAMNWLAQQALKGLREPRDWAAAQIAPLKVFETKAF